MDPTGEVRGDPFIDRMIGQDRQRVTGGRWIAAHKHKLGTREASAASPGGGGSALIRRAARSSFRLEGGVRFGDSAASEDKEPHSGAAKNPKV